MLTRLRRAGPSAERGAALVAVSIAMGTLMVASLAFMQVSVQANKKNRGALDDARALYVAEAGLNEAAASLLVNSDGNIGSAAAPVEFGGGLLWVEATQLSESEWQLRSTALAGGGRAAIESTVQRVREGGIDRPFVSKRKMDVKKGFFADSYDAEKGTYASQAVNGSGKNMYAGSNALVMSNDKLRLDKDVFVAGDVYAGPDEDIEIKKTGFEVTGELGNASEEVVLPSVPMPYAGPSLGKVHVHGVKGDPGVDLMLSPGDYHYEDFKAHKDAVVVIQGPANIVVEKKLDLGAKLVIDDSKGSVNFYVGKHAKIKKDAEIQIASGKPSGLWLVMAHEEEYDDKGKRKKSKHKVKVETAFTGVIYAPDGKVEFKKESEVFGAVMANEMKFKKGTRFHYDESLGRIEAPFGGDTEVVTKRSWNIVALEDRTLLADRTDAFRQFQVGHGELPRPHEVWRPGSYDPDTDKYGAWGPDEIGWDESEDDTYDDPEDNLPDEAHDEAEYLKENG